MNHRVIGIVAGLVVFGLSVRLLAGILSSALPGPLWQAIVSGLDLLFGMVNPALAAIAATVILGGLVWIFIGRRR